MRRKLNVATWKDANPVVLSLMQFFFHFLRSKMRFNYFNEENQTKGQPNFIAVSTEKNQNRSGLI